MEVISIETNAFKTILKKINAIYNLLGVAEENKHKEMILDTSQLCTLLKISRSTAGRLRENGKLSYFQDGRKILYRKSDIELYIENINILNNSSLITGIK